MDEIQPPISYQYMHKIHIHWPLLIHVRYLKIYLNNLFGQWAFQKRL
jgi:hypothetical protein